jgi:hypothetical protein
MKARYYLLACLALTACDGVDPVVVNFTQPFPANTPDLPGFLPRDRGQYTALNDTSKTVVVGEKVLISKCFDVIDVTGAQLDALRIPRRSGSGLGLAQRRYRLRLETPDTLLNFTGPQAPRLRRYRGYYYMSTPSLQDSTKWTVRRLAVSKGRITQQLVNPDSLRMRALEPAIRQQRRARGQLVITLAPQSRRAIRQVSSYAGLWLDLPPSNPTETLLE